MAEDIDDRDYRALAQFRWRLRRFLKFSEDAAADAGISAQQYQALLALRASPGGAMRVGELADALLLRPHSATELVDRLEKLGVVSRSPSDRDRRQVDVAVSAAGEAVLASLAAVHRGELRKIRPELLAFFEAL